MMGLSPSKGMESFSATVFGSTVAPAVDGSSEEQAASATSAMLPAAISFLLSMVLLLHLVRAREKLKIDSVDLVQVLVLVCDVDDLLAAVAHFFDNAAVGLLAYAECRSGNEPFACAVAVHCTHGHVAHLLVHRAYGDGEGLP